MSTSRAIWAGILLGSLLLSACTTTTQDYVLGKLGFFSVRGRLVQIENLTSGEMEALKDGTTVRVDREGCLVTMQCGEESHEFEAGPGCIIVIGGQDDFTNFFGGRMDDLMMFDVALDPGQVLQLFNN